MTENYEVKVPVNPNKKQILYKRLSFVFGFVAIIFAIPSGLYHLGFLAGMILFLILAIVFNQLYLSSISQYIYEINKVRYTVSKTNRFGKTTLDLNSELKNILDYKVIKYEDLDESSFNSLNSCFREDQVCSACAMKKEVYKYFDDSVCDKDTEITMLRYKKNTSIMIVLLKLDTYGQALLINNYEEIKNK